MYFPLLGLKRPVPNPALTQQRNRTAFLRFFRQRISPLSAISPAIRLRAALHQQDRVGNPLRIAREAVLSNIKHLAVGLVGEPPHNALR
jgi:hypothetical protein